MSKLKHSNYFLVVLNEHLAIELGKAVHKEALALRSSLQHFIHGVQETGRWEVTGDGACGEDAKAVDEPGDVQAGGQVVGPRIHEVGHQAVRWALEDHEVLEGVMEE